MRRALKVFLALGAVAGGVLAVLSLLTFDSPKLGAAVLERLGAASGIQLRAEEFRFNVLRGFQLKGIRATGDLPAGQLTATADLLVLNHRLAPLLSRRIAIDSIRLVRPSVVLDSRPTASQQRAAASSGRPATATPESAAEEGDAIGNFTVEVSRLELVDAALEVFSSASPETGTAATQVQGLDLELRDLHVAPGGANPILSMSATGALSADTLRLGESQGTRGNGRLSIDEGHFRVLEFGFLNELGEFEVGELDVDLGRSPFTYTLGFEGSPLNTNLMLGATESNNGFGPARLKLSATGRGPEPSDLIGTGSLSLEAGKLPSHPLLQGIEALLGETRLVGQSYDAFGVDFRVQNNRVELTPFELQAGAVSLGLSGSLDLSGALALLASVKMPRERLKIREISDDVLDALTDERGRTSLPFKITGTAETPRVALDTRTLAKAGRRRVEQKLEKKVRRKLGELLGKID